MPTASPFRPIPRAGERDRELRARHEHGLDLAMPRGYVPFCAVYDVLAGIGLWLIWSL